jgi:hypothetical protein
MGGLARCSSQTAAPACNSHPVTSTRPPGGHDCRTVGPLSCLSRPPPSALAGRGRCTSFATARSPTPPRLAPTPPPSWPTPGTLRSPPWPAALVSHQQPWPAGKLDATPPPGGVEPPSTPTQRFGEIATVLDMRFADGTVVRVRQPERLDPVSITPGLSIFSASYWNARPPPGRPPRSTCVRKLARTGCATSRPRSSRGHLQ